MAPEGVADRTLWCIGRAIILYLHSPSQGAPSLFPPLFAGSLIGRVMHTWTVPYGRCLRTVSSCMDTQGLQILLDPLTSAHFLPLFSLGYLHACLHLSQLIGRHLCSCCGTISLVLCNIAGHMMLWTSHPALWVL